MQKLEDIYKGTFFKNRHKLNWRVPFVCDAIQKVLKPVSVIDVGCAIGDYIMGFQHRGIAAIGLEGSKNCLPYLQVSEKMVYIKDLREPIDIGKYDLAMCFEVLEHVEEEFADMLVDNLVRMADRLLLSAATPGQEGHHHVNCQERDYWIYKFDQRGYIRDKKIEDAIKIEWESLKNKKEMRSYYENLLFFQRWTD